MKSLTMDDGTGRPQRFEAETYQGLIEEINRNAFTPSNSLEEYMEGMARRHKMWDGTEIRTDTAEHFLTDLDKCGTLKLRASG